MSWLGEQETQGKPQVTSTLYNITKSHFRVTSSQRPRGDSFSNLKKPQSHATQMFLLKMFPFCSSIFSFQTCLSRTCMFSQINILSLGCQQNREETVSFVWYHLCFSYMTLGKAKFMSQLQVFLFDLLHWCYEFPLDQCDSHLGKILSPRGHTAIFGMLFEISHLLAPSRQRPEMMITELEFTEQSHNQGWCGPKMSTVLELRNPLQPTLAVTKFHGHPNTYSTRGTSTCPVQTQSCISFRKISGFNNHPVTSIKCFIYCRHCFMCFFVNFPAACLLFMTTLGAATTTNIIIIMPHSTDKETKVKEEYFV